MTVPEPFGSTTTLTSASWRGGMICGSSKASLNFAPTTSSPDSNSVQVGWAPASWQAPLHDSKLSAGEAVRVTWSKAGNSPLVQLSTGHEINPSELVTVSAGSPPSNATVRLVGVNVATTVRSESTVIVQSPVPGHSKTLHPTKPVVVAGFNVTWSPAVTGYRHD